MAKIKKTTIDAGYVITAVHNTTKARVYLNIDERSGYPVWEERIKTYKTFEDAETDVERFAARYSYLTIPVDEAVIVKITHTLTPVKEKSHA